MAKIKLDSALYARVKKAAAAEGYSSADEFVTHIIEKELERLEGLTEEEEENVRQQLRGLGYIE